MLPLLAALALAQAPWPLPAWAVVEFRDLVGGNAAYGRMAARAVAERLAEARVGDVAPEETVSRALETLHLTSPPEGLVNLSRIGQEALGQTVREGRIVEGQITEASIEHVKGGRRAHVALRVVGYDVASALPMTGALERGESPVRTGAVSDEALIGEAIQRAAEAAVRKMRGVRLPTATILNTYTRNAVINRGARAGFETGQTVIVSRGANQICTGRVGVVGQDRAEIAYTRVFMGPSPGDTVRGVFTPPPLPPAGIAVLKGGD